MKSRCEGPSLPARLPPPRTLVLWSSPSSPCPTARWRSGLTGDLLASGWGQWGAGGQEETPNAAGPPPQGWQGAAGTGEGCAARCPMLQPFPVLVRCQRDIPTCQRTPPSPFPPHPASPPASK